MDRDDVLKKMLERLDGDKEDDARRGNGHLTRKPCPGCGRPSVWPYRNVEYVCISCRRLLMQAIEAQLHHPDADEELVVVSERDWETRYMEGEYESYWEGTKAATPRHRLEVAMHNLVLEISQKAAGENPGSHCYLFEQGRIGSMSWRVVRRIRKVVAGLLVDLDSAIRDSIEECARLAERKGQDVLRQLASGSMSIDDLNNANAKLAAKPGKRRG